MPTLRKRRIKRKPFPSMFLPDGRYLLSTRQGFNLPVGVNPWDVVLVDPQKGLVENKYTGWGWTGMHLPMISPLVAWCPVPPDDWTGDE